MLIFIRAFFVIATIVVSGCATTNEFSSIPTDESDFNKPLAEIRDNFSDVSKLEDEYKWEWGWTVNSSPKTGKLSTLEDKWGKADNVQTHWTAKISITLFNAVFISLLEWQPYVFVITEAMFIFPQETHQWNKGDTTISATVSRLGDSMYERRVGYWEWTKTPNMHAKGVLPATSNN